MERNDLYYKGVYYFLTHYIAKHDPELKSMSCIDYAKESAFDTADFVDQQVVQIANSADFTVAISTVDPLHIL